MRKAPVPPPVFPILAVLCLLVGAVAGIATTYTVHKNPGLMVSSILDPRGQFRNADGALQQRINILVLGIDDNWTNQDLMYTRGARSDTNIVLSLDLAQNKAYMLSIPRDSRVPIAGTHHLGKINGAYATGGVQRALQTVSNFLDVPIDHYLILKINATKNLVDSIGGVDLNVEKDMDYDDKWGHLHIHLKHGYQHLNGEQAVGYIRFRHDREGDFGRIRRQQQLMHTIASKLENPMMIRQAANLVHTFRQWVDTDLTENQLLALAMLYKGTTPSQIVAQYLPATNERIRGVWFLVPDEEKKKLLVNWLLKGDLSAETPLIPIVVYNGCGSEAAVRTVRDRLRNAGFSVQLGGDEDRSDYATTLVIDHDHVKGAGALVASRLGFNGTPELQPDPQADSAVDVIVGRDVASTIVASRPG